MSHRLDVHVEHQLERDEVYVRVTLKKNGEHIAHIMREVVLVVVHVEICAPRAFFWTAVCLLCDEYLPTGQSALMVATLSLGCQHLSQRNASANAETKIWEIACASKCWTRKETTSNSE